MEVLAMRLHARERWKLRQIEEALRKDDPGLDALLAGRPPPRQQRRSPRARAVWWLAAYLVPLALVLAGVIAGLLLHATWLVVAGAISCLFIPVMTWLLIRRHVIRGGPSHCRKP